MGAMASVAIIGAMASVAIIDAGCVSSTPAGTPHTPDPDHSDYHPVLGTPQPPKTVPSGDIYFECTAAGGDISKWSRVIDSSGMATGSLIFNATRDDRVWAPVAVIALGAKDEQPHPALLIKVNRKLDTLETYLLPAATHERTRLWADVAPMSVGTELHFAIRWTASEAEIRLEPGGRLVKVALPSNVGRLWLGCSTGDVIFHDVAVTPPAASP